MSDPDRSPPEATPAAPADEAEKPALHERDMVFVHSRSNDGDGVRVLRSRRGHFEVGELRGMREGQSIAGEVVRLQPSEEHDNLYDVETLVERPRPTRQLSGPAQVASEAYRRQWDAIFGSNGETEQDPSELN